MVLERARRGLKIHSGKMPSSLSVAVNTGPSIAVLVSPGFDQRMPKTISPNVQNSVKSFINKVPFFHIKLNTFWSHTTNMATFIGLTHPVTGLVTDVTSPDKLTNDFLILNF